MKNTKIENNTVSAIGEIVSELTFSHEIFGERFYTVDILVNRLSDETDTIPLMISERLVDAKANYVGRMIKVTGQFRSYNFRIENKNKLVLRVFAREIQFVEECSDYAEANHITLDGFICKPVTYRKTPLGREIADIILAVNRPYGKSDYIPCIAWGRNAVYASGLDVGQRIELSGRIQSREYTKAISETETKTLTTYEVSVSRMEVNHA